MSMFREFWMIWMAEGGAPTFQHYSREAAKAEVERLARAHPGQRFYLLYSIGAAQKSDVEWLDATDESNLDVPF